MFARAHTFTIDGFQTRHVTVEVDIRAGLPAFAVVGLADAAVREARERVRTAIRNSGYEFPARRITANLAPGDVPKAGPALDLPLACAVAVANYWHPWPRAREHQRFPMSHEESERCQRRRWASWSARQDCPRSC